MARSLVAARRDGRPVKPDVTLRLDELAEIWRALHDPERCKSDPVTVAAMKLLILTGKARHVFESPLRPGQALYGRAVNNALATLFRHYPAIAQFISRQPEH